MRAPVITTRRKRRNRHEPIGFRGTFNKPWPSGANLPIFDVGSAPIAGDRRVRVEWLQSWRETLLY